MVELMKHLIICCLLYTSCKEEISRFKVYWVNGEEKTKLENYMFPDKDKGVLPAVVGKPATWIAEQAGIKVPEDTQILLACLLYTSRCV